MPKVSICISSFNKAPLLKNTLDTIFCQHPPFAFEVIVIDDGSPNAEVSKICTKYPVVCKRIEREPIFRNPCTARNLAYKTAASDIIISQSDEVLHITPNAIELLVEEIKPNTFILAHVFCLNKRGQISGEFTGPKRKAPYFFLGALYRRDIYAVGGNDEEFAICPAYEDAWFGDCLTKGLQLTPIYTTKVVGHHQWHEYCTRPENEGPSRELYHRKVRNKVFCSAGGPWPYIEYEEKDMEKVENIFTEIYQQQHWGGGESISGAGSTVEATTRLREALPFIFKTYGISSLLDLPCGDYNWMRHVDLKGIDYIGGDIVADLIHKNEERYPDVEFCHLDLLTSQLPRVDCILCRDCLVHFSFEDIKHAIMNIRAYGIKYILATTFTNRTNDKTIKTGQWTPYNLQAPPFNLPSPLFLVNENCQEWYPHFNDKSVGLWEVRELEKALFPTKSITVCVDYDDFLAITLPNNKKHFSKTLVVTASHDIKTQNVCKNLGVECHVTDVFYENGASFNKGAAMEEGFDVLGREGWICVWDADIIMPEDIFVANKKTNCMYSPQRLILEDPVTYSKDLDWSTLKSPTQSHEFSGFFQLFHANAPISKPWYSIDWNHAGGCDSDFQFKFSSENLIRLPFKVLHLGAEGISDLDTRIGKNWLGRVTPKISTDELPEEADVKYQNLLKMIEDRKKYGTSREKIKVAAPVASQVVAVTSQVATSSQVRTNKIPKQISFFWTGRMSWMRWLTLYSFRKHNPTWTINLYKYIEPCGPKKWTTGEEADLLYTGPDYCEQIEELNVQQREYTCPVKNLPPAQVSDIFQWEILSTIGGFYADMDFIWLKPLDGIADMCYYADAIFSLECGFPAIGFFGAIPNCPLFKDIFSAVAQGNSHSYQGYGTLLLSNLFCKRPPKCKLTDGSLMLANIKTAYPQLAITDIPDMLVYPFNWKEIPLIFSKVHEVDDRAVGVHWFGGSPITQKWNNLLTVENWRNYENTFTACVKHLFA